MRARSKKTEKQYVERRALVARLLEERPACEACLPLAAMDGKTGFVRPSVDIHEIKTRARGGSILDEQNLLAVCRFPCHSRITDKSRDGEWCGLVLPSWATEEHYAEALTRRTSLANGDVEIGDPSWW